MAIIDTLRAFSNALVARSDAEAIEAALQEFYADLHTLAGVPVPVADSTASAVASTDPAAPAATTKASAASAASAAPAAPAAPAA